MEVPIYAGSSSFSASMTPFQFYDTDSQFVTDADKVVKYCARRMGYPIVNIELQDLNFYAAFEEAVTTYGNEVYAYKVRQDYLSIEGASTGSSMNHALVTPNQGTIIRLSDQYGTEAGTGGTIQYRTGSIALTSGQQEYDLNVWASSSGYSSGDIEIKKIFYEGPPALAQFYDPYAELGLGSNTGSGLGGVAPVNTFVLAPLSMDLQMFQAIEMSNTVRRSNYSFEITNNNVRIFPIPTDSLDRLYFHYILKSQRLNNGINTGSAAVITNVSNVPYSNPSYTQINSIGRSWIFEYTLAICKEILGYVRGKYTDIPLVTVNSSDLISSATNDKAKLIENLRSYLDETSREKLMEKQSKEAEYMTIELNKTPFVIYLG